MRGRRVLMESFVAHGVRHIFGNPGTTETPLLDSLPAFSQIDYVMALHEGVAVSAASFYAQASGRPAVANLHVAPGLIEGTRMADRVPEEIKNGARAQTVLGKTGSADDIAQQVVTFCRSESVSGQTVVVDGGMPIGMR